jgi:hypothetical protein
LQTAFAFEFVGGNLLHRPLSRSQKTQ